MNWNDIPRHPSTRLLRQFGGLCSGICLVMASAAALSVAGTAVVPARMWSWLTAGLGVGLVTLLRPTALRPVFVGWLILAFPIGWIVGRLALATIFFGLFTAVGLLFRMTGRDPLGRSRRADTYWTARDHSTTPADYLRQY
jgi:hypothetical protein